MVMDHIAGLVPRIFPSVSVGKGTGNSSPKIMVEVYVPLETRVTNGGCRKECGPYDDCVCSYFL